MPLTGSPNSSSLHIDHLRVLYSSGEALRNVTLHLPTGQVIGVVGPNGAGKSTLLKALVGLVPIAMGQMYYGIQPLQPHQVAYVPQRSAVDWHYPVTVWDVVLMGQVVAAGWLQRLSQQAKARAWAALEQVGMQAFRDRPIGELSGGQQQRVFLARAIAQQTEIFLLDEPLAGVDQANATLIFDILHDLAAAGKTVVVVHHDLGEAVSQFDQVVLLNREVIAYGTPQAVLTTDQLHRAYGAYVVAA
ncbi:MAG: metal ABC transporter ATP-binding protein [Synechococcaceae cyanobacterium SM2_3_60]|nr:metal ABC transporter ATP-binding protein [Synechococcaceae cyanobacterium SM2_3_60]